jgi:hypothetical protein
VRHKGNAARNASDNQQKTRCWILGDAQIMPRFVHQRFWMMPYGHWTPKASIVFGDAPVAWWSGERTNKPTCVCAFVCVPMLGVVCCRPYAAGLANKLPKKDMCSKDRGVSRRYQNKNGEWKMCPCQFATGRPTYAASSLSRLPII